MDSAVSLVVIGRNEGDRLRRCLTSLPRSSGPIVYVDSGSSDGSALMARSMGIEAIDLDAAIPFTAARARNAGFERLLEICPEMQFVQFVDGDCEIDAGWIEQAQAFLLEHPRVAVVGGRLRERFPEASIYNRLCDLEWNTPLGESAWCGGNTMMRAESLREVGGFNPALIAGEEPEMCVRLREKGWTIYRIDADVALHDADMHRFGQWWRRAMRTGYAFAEGAHLHDGSPERYCVREVRSGWLWGLAIPVEALAAAWPTRGLSLLVAIALYGVLFAKVWRHACRSGLAKGKPVAIYAWFAMLGKFPQAMGQLRYCILRWRGRKSALIEYKSMVPSPPVLRGKGLG